MTTKQQDHEGDKELIRASSVIGYDVDDLDGVTGRSYRSPSRKQVMQAVDRNSIKLQQRSMSATANAEMAHQAARDARKAKTAKEYKGVK